MNILIDMLGIRKQKAGVGVYAKNLIDEIVLVDSGNQYFILAQDDDSDFDYSDRRNTTMIWVRASLLRKFPLRLLYEQLIVPFLVIRRHIQLIHSLHYSFPLLSFGAKRVVTLHDMTSFLMPEVHVAIKVWYFRTFIRAAVNFADAIIFVSESGRKDCSSMLGKCRGLSAVIHHGKNDSFQPAPNPEATESVVKRYLLPERFILYIGTIEPRKNLRCLVKAFALVSQHYPDIWLVIAGMKGWRDEYNQVLSLIREHDLEYRVLFPGFVAEEDKPYLLASATVFVYPSLYEGFGLPVLEAMACGVPTITSDISSLPEVAGDGAVLVSPGSETQMAEALEILLSNPALREEIRVRAIKQAARFSWSQAARSTTKLYSEVFAEGSSETS